MFNPIKINIMDTMKDMQVDLSKVKGASHKVEISIEDLRSQYSLLKNMNIEMFTGEGIDFSEFIKQFVDYQRDISVTSNYFCAKIIVDGIKKYANTLFLETMRCAKWF